MYAAEKEPDSMLVDVGFDDPYLNFEEPQPVSIQLLGGNSNGQCTFAGMTWDCMSANRLREMGAAEEMVSSRRQLYQEGTRSHNDPDVALGVQAINMGLEFSKTNDYRALAQAIWRDVCGGQGQLQLP